MKYLSYILLMSSPAWGQAGHKVSEPEAILGHSTEKAAPPKYEFKEGFGLEAKEFLLPNQIPTKIAEVGHDSVRKFCVCTLSAENCLTSFAVTNDGVFMTNEHALEMFTKSFKDTKKMYYLETGKPCPYVGVVMVEPPNTVMQVKITDIKRGSWPAPKADAKQAGYDPDTYYQGKGGNHTNDLATFKVEVIPTSQVRPKPPGGPLVTKAIELSDDSAFVGQKVFHLGFPQIGARVQGLDPLPQVSGGAISALNGVNIEADFLGTFGTSGGPVLDEQGKLLGVFWGKEATFRESFRSGEMMASINKYGHPRERSYVIPLANVKAFIEASKQKAK